MAHDPRAHSTVISPPPLYREYSLDSDTGFDPVQFYGRDTPSDGSMYSISHGSTTTNGRRPSDASHFAPSAFHDRRFSDASNVLPLPIDIDHRQRSSSGSSGSQQSHDHRQPREQYSDLYVAAGLPTPPGSSIRGTGRALHANGNGVLHLEQLSITEHDDPAVYHSLHPPSLSPLSAAHSVRNFSNPQSPLLAPRPTRQHSFQRLQVPCTCTFFELENGNMVLCPPAEADNQTPLYTVHVSPSCFQPTLFITTVKRGGPGSKELVARLEMGMSRDPSTIFMGNTAQRLSAVFSEFRKVKSKLKDRWQWHREKICRLQWFYSGDYEAVCHLDADTNKTPLAVLISGAGAYAGGAVQLSEPPTTKLRIVTQDQSMLDDIVVSALLVERKRLMPVEGNLNKDLFN